MKRTASNHHLPTKNENSFSTFQTKRTRLSELKSHSIENRQNKNTFKFKIFKRARIAILSLILIIIFFGVLYQYFKIKLIQYDGKNISVNEKYLGKSYMFFDHKIEEKSLQLIFPNLNIKVKKIFPDKISITAIDIEGFVLLTTPEGKKAIINKDGLILTIYKKDTDFLLNGNIIKINTQIRGLLSDAKTNKSISNTQILKLISVLKNLGDKSLVINQVSIDSALDVIIDFGEYEWIMTLKKDIYSQISAFGVIFDEMNNLGKKFDRIDTRFNQPLVKY